MGERVAQDFLPFIFQTRRGKLDWRSISNIDLDRVAREADIDLLEQHLKGLAFADVTTEGACGMRSLVCPCAE